jgi:Zn-finger nucleic acid-binding protein
MNCPKCDAPMAKVTHENVEVDRCTTCNGIWFDALEKERLKNLSGSEQIDVGDYDPATSGKAKRQLACPVCHTPMIVMSVPDHPGLKYESCTVCFGAFFDAGEFRAYKGGSGLLARLKGLIGLS